jgi:L-alanine-DL-glutamate epimerase-like enolase superfamily enzyme
MKIGAIDFDKEYAILKQIRSQFSEKELELRVDANGAFPLNEALNKLDELAKLQIHSIEQPIKARNIIKMAELCKNTPLPIALDEELIGVFEIEQKAELLEKIKPQFIILKPALIGGFSGSDEWIKLAKQQKINWWITSALESNIGLNAIAQFTALQNNELPQGLGTGQVFSNNLESPLYLKGENLFYGTKEWNLSIIDESFSSSTTKR